MVFYCSLLDIYRHCTPSTSALDDNDAAAAAAGNAGCGSQAIKGKTLGNIF